MGLLGSIKNKLPCIQTLYWVAPLIVSTILGMSSFVIFIHYGDDVESAETSAINYAKRKTCVIPRFILISAASMRRIVNFLSNKNPTLRRIFLRR
jgi:hypothetical protein